MALNRLTNRARLIIEDVSTAERVPARDVLTAIRKSSGLGTYLTKALPHISVEKTQKINVNRLVKEAYFQSIKFQHPYVGTEHLLLALLKLANSSDMELVRTEIIKLSIFPSYTGAPSLTDKTPLLGTYSENLTDLMFKPAYSRVVRDELQFMLSGLLQKNNSNVLVVGDSGVGKRSLVELMAQKILSLDVPPLLIGYQVVDLDLTTFVASVLNKPGNVQQNIISLVDELKGLNRAIVYIKNLHNVFISTSAGIAVPIIYSLLKASLESANVRIIATMDLALYEKLAAENYQLFEGFSVITLEEPSSKDTLTIMEEHADILAEYHNMKIKKKTVKYAYGQAKELDSGTKFPQKGVDLVDKACAYETLKKSKVPGAYKSLVESTFDIADHIDTFLASGRYDEAIAARKRLVAVEKKLLRDEGSMFFGDVYEVTEDSIESVIKAATPSQDVSAIDLSKLRKLDAIIKKRIIGQDAAVENVVKSLIRASFGLRSKRRPVGNFLFLGPTGVGKTELAKVLAEEAFGDESLIRLDMSDFGEKHTVARLVGAPPGYVGYGEGGELTSRIERKPDSIVLFDEIEKAHPDVLNILLQIMEEAELTDARGNRFDFSNTVIILTSNLGTEILHQGDIGFNDNLESDSTVEARLTKNLKKILKPELINRFDDVVVFKRLNKRSQLQIVNLLIKEIKESLKDKNITIKIDAKIKSYLLGIGYSDEYGARSLRRTLERELLDRVAEVLLNTDVSDNGLKLGTSIEDGKLKVVVLK